MFDNVKHIHTNSVSEMFEQILNDKADIRPVTYVPAGTRMIVFPKVDLWLRDIENEILTTPNNIFTPHIDDEDTPLMRGLKQAVLQKHIDIDKYSDSYGENYPNDKRKFKEHDISIKLFERHIDVLGIKAVLVLSDKSPDVPNPMGKPIYISLNYNEDDGEVDCIAEDNTE